MFSEMLGETVSIDGGTLLLILLGLVILVGLAIGLVVLGFVLALRAGRGTQRAFRWWIAVLVVECFYVVGSVVSILTGNFSEFVLAPIAVVAGQVAMYRQARKEAGR